MKHETAHRELRNRSGGQEEWGRQVPHQKITNFTNNEHEFSKHRERPNLMNTNSPREYTYALLVHSRERNRDILENALFIVCILSVVFAMWQFASQPTPVFHSPEISVQNPVELEQALVAHRHA
jgi:hypothetical protein